MNLDDKAEGNKPGSSEHIPRIGRRFAMEIQNHPGRFVVRGSLEPGYALRTVLSTPKNTSGRTGMLIIGSIAEALRLSGYAGLGYTALSNFF